VPDIFDTFRVIFLVIFRIYLSFKIISGKALSLAWQTFATLNQRQFFAV